jgi:hypothetical protein
MEIKRFNSAITKNVEYNSEVKVGTISLNSYITISIIKNSIVQKIKYIISKVF